MVFKRSYYGDDNDYGFEIPGHLSKKRNVFNNAILDAMGGISVDEIVLKMEPFFRKVVREEMEQLVLPLITTSLRSVEPCKGRSFLLHFVNKLPTTIFTGSKVEAEDGTPVRILLLDATTRAIVNSGPLSSKRVDILVLDGDFGSDEKEEWTEKEFNHNVVRERQGKRPLVTGELSITLRDGVGQIGDVFFTDNSSWVRCRKFRLGVKISHNSTDEIRIREGRSAAFMVKDHRGELYKKHHPPSLHDDIWRLERIAKDGAFHKRLASRRIQTVDDFLRLYQSHPDYLRNILGNQISSKTWETIVEHATECLPDERKFYTYTSAVQSMRLLFNSIYKVVGATIAGETHVRLDKLNLSQKLLVDDVKRQAYKNMKDLVSVDAGGHVNPPVAFSNLQLEASQSLGFQNHKFSVTQRDSPGRHAGFDQSSNARSYTYEAIDRLPKEVCFGQTNLPQQMFNPLLRNSFTYEEFLPIHQSGGDNWSPTHSLEELLHQSYHSLADDIEESTWGHGNSILLSSSSNDYVSYFQNRSTAGWCKLRAAFLCSLVRRDVAAKRRAPRCLYDNYSRFRA